MKPNYIAALVIGGVTGLVMALALLTFFAATGAVPSLGVEVDGTDVIPTFSPAASATWMIIILAGLTGGAILATITRAVARVISPESKAASTGVIAAIGAGVAAIVGMVVFPLGISVTGSITDGHAVIAVAHFVLLAAIAGFIAGAVVAWISYVLARPSKPAVDPELQAA